jgi:hypothetical protein
MRGIAPQVTAAPADKEEKKRKKSKWSDNERTTDSASNIELLLVTSHLPLKKK